jgi:hypothetical protein
MFRMQVTILDGLETCYVGLGLCSMSVCRGRSQDRLAACRSCSSYAAVR